jgi:hypothetical protein
LAPHLSLAFKHLISNRTQVEAACLAYASSRGIVHDVINGDCSKIFGQIWTSRPLALVADAIKAGERVRSDLYQMVALRSRAYHR